MVKLSQLLFKPYFYFAIAVVFCLIFILISQNATIDIQDHDTYYVVTKSSIFGILLILCVVFALIYFFMPLSNKLGLIHTFGTLLGFSWLPLLLYNTFNPLPERFYSFDQLEVNFAFLIISFFILMVAQLVFIANVIFTVVNNFRK